MFVNEDEGFQELYDRLLTYSTEQSVKTSESKRQTRRDDPMDVDALTKGTSKGKVKKGFADSGKWNKGQDHMSNMKCWNCDRAGHYGRDCGENWSKEKTISKGKESKVKSKSKTKGKGKEKLNKKVTVISQARWRACRWMVEEDRLADRIKFRMVDDSNSSDTLGIRRTSGRIGGRQR